MTSSAHSPTTWPRSSRTWATSAPTKASRIETGSVVSCTTSAPTRCRRWPRYDPSGSRPRSLHARGMAPRPGRNLREGGGETFRPDELHRLDRRPPRLARAAHSSLASAGRRPVSRHPDRVRVRCADDHPIAEADARRLEQGDEGCGSIPGFADNEGPAEGPAGE